MAAESLLRAVENRGVVKWHSFKDVAAFESPSKDTVTQESSIELHGNLADLVVSRCDSAPPSMEGSFPAVRTHLVDQNCSANASLGDFGNTLERVKSNEQVPSDPENFSCNFAKMNLHHHAVENSTSFKDNRVLTSTDDGGDGTLQGSASTHKEENEEESQPLRASQEVAESVASAGENNTNLVSHHKSLVDRIQEDFPRTPPVYDRPRSSCDTKPYGLSELSTSISSSFNLDETESRRDNKYVNSRYSSAVETPTIDSRSDSEIKISQEKQQSYRKNVRKLRVSSQEDFPFHRARVQTISQGMNHLPGFAPPYREASSFIASGNHFFLNHQPSSLYTQQYNLAGYAPGSTHFAPFTGYSPLSLVPFPSSPSYVGVTTGVSAPDGIAHMGDVRQQSKFYGQHVSMPQPLQFCPQPLHDVYGSSVQHGQSASSGIFGNHFAQPESTYLAYMGDQKFHPLSNGNLNVSTPIQTAITGCGNSPFVNVMAQLPSSMQHSQGSIRNMGTCSEWQGKRGFGDSDRLENLSSLEEVKSGNAHRIELSNIEGCIIDFCVDQHGSRFIQQKLEHCSPEEKMSVFKEVIPHASRLIIDVFGNYVIQKFLEHGSSEQRKELADALSGQMLSWSLQMYGCRVIQKALEVIELDQKLLLVKELDGHVMKCVRDQNGNHVIQKCIECLPTEEIGFILSSFQGHVLQLASHPYGCRVIQRVLEHCLDHIQCQCIINEILESALILAHDQYGNYVIQDILKREKVHKRSQIINKFAGKVVQMSQDKFASHVIEKCLKHGNTTEKELLVERILDLSGEKDNLLAMMKDQYANHVIHKIFDFGNERQRKILLDHSRLHINALKKYTYGKYIAARVEQLPGEETGVA